MNSDQNQITPQRRGGGLLPPLPPTEKGQRLFAGLYRRADEREVDRAYSITPTSCAGYYADDAVVEYAGRPYLREQGFDTTGRSRGAKTLARKYV